MSYESLTISDHEVALPVISSSVAAGSAHGCRFCNAPLKHTFVDLGVSPLCQSWLSREELNHMEPAYPLHAFVCAECLLVQVNEYVSGEKIFGGEYAYFSSYSDSWLAHAKRYAEMITQRLGLDATSQVVEIASNDGYLLQNFVRAGIPALGIEPAENCAEVARGKGVETRCKFFGVRTATELKEQGIRADLLVGNNVLAHVPDLNDFVAGLKVLLAEDGVNTMEFPHLMRLVELNQFDTIYQEHYSYLSLLAVQRIFAFHGLTIFDVEELPTHGGSLRIYARHTENAAREVTPAVEEVLERERAAGLERLETYTGFAQKVMATKRKLLRFLLDAKDAGKTVVAYGAPGKGATLLNYCGIREDFIDYTVDRNPYKQGRFMPGARIPVFAPEKIAETRPDYVLILPWNLRDEIMEQLSVIRSWGGQFVIPIPEVQVV
ncbi:MAG TPA: class I SAM-dependent methyltransferase [Pirellulaceae bacterium]|nr:class I SAM-dependent methyltransferase [Pirellulaceae bacterium]